MTRVCDLSDDLVREIFARVPITSLSAVRSTCKLWESLSKNWILGKSLATKQKFLGFMTMDSKLCSLTFDIKGKDKDVVDLSIKQVELLDDGDEISEVLHCDGLLLCVIKYTSRLLVWNPYLEETRYIDHRLSFHSVDWYAFGYENNIKRNHKIFFRFLDQYDDHEDKAVFGYKIYDFSFDSWRVLDVTPDPDLHYDKRGVSLKGNTYSFVIDSYENRGYFLLCFDFTTEKFGPCLPLPFYPEGDPMALSSVREKQLAVLFQSPDFLETELEIWVTTDIKPNTLSWSKFLKVDVQSITNDFEFLTYDFHVYTEDVSFFIDEEEKVAVVFDEVGRLPDTYYTALVIGDDGYDKSVRLGEAPDHRDAHKYFSPLSCSSYLPSLVQIKQSRKRKHLDD